MSLPDHDAASRRRFITQVLGGTAGLGALAACGPAAGVFSTPGGSPSARYAFRDGPLMQAALHRFGVLGVRKDGVGIVRDDVRGNAAMVRHVTQRPRIVVCETCPTLNANYDGVSLVSVNPVIIAGLANMIGTYFEFDNLTDTYDVGFAISFPTYAIYGQIYSGGGDPLREFCNEKLASEIQQQAQLVGAWIAGATLPVLQSLSQHWQELKSAAKLYEAGEITFAEFLAVLNTVMTPTALADVFAWAGVGVGVALFYQYMVCRLTGQF